VLARVVQAEPAWVRGQTRLDPGCGSGVAGIAAYDIDPVALAIAAQNARANAVELLQGPRCSMRPAPRVSLVSSSGTSSMSAPRCRPCGPGYARPTGRGGRVLIADASRPFVPTAGVRCLWEERLATAWAWEGTHVRTVRLLTLDV
jgi:hypothetical protein